VELAIALERGAGGAERTRESVHHPDEIARQSSGLREGATESDERVRQDRESLAYRRQGRRKGALNIRTRVDDSFQHPTRDELALLGHGAKLGGGDSEFVRDGPDDGALRAERLHHRIELVAAKHARLQGLTQLQDGAVRLVAGIAR
jgi:hypothetical protein